MENCLFCKIVNKEIESEIILENDYFLVFSDIHPKANIHFLIVPKRHIKSVDDVVDGDELILGKMFTTAKEAAKKLEVSGAYRLGVNVGKDGGQEIEHIHMHLLSDKTRKGVEKV